jgi:hypothetical protein
MTNHGGLSVFFGRQNNLSTEAFLEFYSKYKNYIYKNFTENTSIFTFEPGSNNSSFILKLNPTFGKHENNVLNYIDCLEILKRSPVIETKQTYSYLDYNFEIVPELRRTYPCRGNAIFYKNYNIYQFDNDTDYFIEAEYTYLPKLPNGKLNPNEFDYIEEELYIDVPYN